MTRTQRHIRLLDQTFVLVPKIFLCHRQWQQTIFVKAFVVAVVLVFSSFIPMTGQFGLFVNVHHE